MRLHAAEDTRWFNDVFRNSMNTYDNIAQRDVFKICNITFEWWKKYSNFWNKKKFNEKHQDRCTKFKSTQFINLIKSLMRENARE